MLELNCAVVVAIIGPQSTDCCALACDVWPTGLPMGKHWLDISPVMGDGLKCVLCAT